MRITIEIDEGSAVLSTRAAVAGAEIAEIAAEADGGAAADQKSADVAERFARRDAADAGGPPDWLTEAIGAAPFESEAGLANVEVSTEATVAAPAAFEVAEDLDGGAAQPSDDFTAG